MVLKERALNNVATLNEVDTVNMRNNGQNFLLKMMCNISQDKAFKILEWILFIGFSIVAGWFASGVLQHY